MCVGGSSSDVVVVVVEDGKELYESEEIGNQKKIISLRCQGEEEKKNFSEEGRTKKIGIQKLLIS
jgi:hypothetical protein